MITFKLNYELLTWDNLVKYADDILTCMLVCVSSLN